jgi:phospholipid/cholesterol/gamma-HCH transport system substrate-binding protein
MTHVEGAAREAENTVGLARERFVDGPQVTRIFNNVERASSAFNEHLVPLARDLGTVMGDAKKITGVLASPEQLARYDTILRDVSSAARVADGAAKDARQVINHVKRGEGTLGAFVMDEAVYDDFQELIRDLKHNPWKFFWRQ